MSEMMKKIRRKLARMTAFRFMSDPRFNAELLRLFARRVGDPKVADFLADDAHRLIGRILLDGNRSKAQIFQDLWVLHETGEMRGGFFVEFGATDGVSLSNTLLLEAEYGWTGILAEPNPVWHERLRANRKAAISDACVAARDGETVSFLATDQPELGTMAAFAPSDTHAGARLKAENISVTTKSLNTLLAEHNAPRRIDFMSIDTEGSEYDILSAFDFSAYDVRLLAIEHNMTAAEQKLDTLLARHGFERRFREMSWFDGWYAKRDGV
jgi:FkbM family methyltransferase